MDVEMMESRGVKRTASEAELPPEAPRRIKALDRDVVNKIAAGEIIVAPVNALKEMLENSVDAGATQIEIVVKEGGLKLLQITDNGHGIEKDDLTLLCERFATSKLQKFEDLQSIATYGFRGEALASISHIAHLKVTTKTANSSCAWQAHYADGKLIPAKPGQTSDPKPCAGRGGTQITVEDLFYNVPHRRRAFRSSADEYAKILDIVGRYAIHCASVGFSIKKQGESGSGFTIAAAASILDRIRQAHGTGVAKEVIEIKVESNQWGFKASGYVSNANYSAKRMSLLLFINHRAVESSTVKRALEQTFQIFLPKGGHPFVYLSLEIDPQRLDVNVHPTKREVRFLNEDEVIEEICSNIRQHLVQVDTSRTFKTQTLLPGVIPMTVSQPRNNDDEDSPGRDQSKLLTTPAPKKTYENNLVRTDSKMRKITSMLAPALSKNASADEQNIPQTSTQYVTTAREQIQIRLTSVKSLRAAVRDQMHNGLTEMFAALTYVGLVDDARRIVAVQSGVKLYLIDYGSIANEFFYQVGLTDFGNFGIISFIPAPDLKELLKIAAELEIEKSPDCADLDPDQVVSKVYAQLISRAEMLREYFSLGISGDGALETIPLLLKDYTPCMAKLPTFLLRLGPFVNWTDEQSCFDTFLQELASFYVPEQLPRRDRRSPDNDHEEHTSFSDPVETRRKELEHVLEHVLFPAVRSRIVGTKGMLPAVIEVANLKGLYRTFERC